MKIANLATVVSPLESASLQKALPNTVQHFCIFWLQKCSTVLGAPSMRMRPLMERLQQPNWLFSSLIWPLFNLANLTSPISQTKIESREIDKHKIWLTIVTQRGNKKANLACKQNGSTNICAYFRFNFIFSNSYMSTSVIHFLLRFNLHIWLNEHLRLKQK